MGKFEKGKSGNPGGRPKVVADLQALAREHTEAAVLELARLGKSAKSETARISAICALLDRGYGRPIQGVEHSGVGGAPIDHSITVRFVAAKGKPD